jgi:uncharacterized membrane protein YidH (DUF202 family)
MSLPPHQRKPALLDTIRAVLWGFLGVRRKTDSQQDIDKLNPLHLIAVGLVLAVLFVVGLMVLVSWAVKVA